MAAVAASAGHRADQIINSFNGRIKRYLCDTCRMINISIDHSVQGEKAISNPVGTVGAAHTLNSQKSRLNIFLLVRGCHLLKGLNMTDIVHEESPVIVNPT